MRTAGVLLRRPGVPAAREEAGGQKARLQGEGERVEMEEYLEFLRGKIWVAQETGFEVDPARVNPALKSHQRDAVGYLKEFEETEETLSLFDMIG